MSKNLKIILFVSLAVNLLLIGAIGGRALYGFKHGHPRFMPPHGMKQELSSILPADKVEMFEESMRKNFKKRKDTFPKIKAAHEKMERIMTADSFDKEAFKLQMEELDSLQARTFRGMGDSLLDLLPQLTKEQRIAFAEHIKRNKPNPGIMMPPPPMMGMHPGRCIKSPPDMGGNSPEYDSVPPAP